MEDDGTISNIRVHSERNILEKNGVVQNNKDQSRIRKREVVDEAQTAN